MLPCSHIEYYEIAIHVMYTHRPKLLTTYNIVPFMASVTEVLIDKFHYIDVQC